MESNYGFSYLPNIHQIKLIKKIVGNRKILEVGGGKGLLGGVLRSSGFDIKVTDLYGNKKGDFIDVEELSCLNAIKKYNDYQCLLMSWGPNENGYFDKKSYYIFKGDMIILIGEEKGGCTCNGYLNNIDKWYNWVLIKQIHHHYFYFIDDSIKIYQRIC